MSDYRALVRYVCHELVELRAKVFELEPRLTEAEEKPKEIIQEIERIWQGDSETGSDKSHEYHPGISKNLLSSTKCRLK